jgi:dTDP-4-amino-4,6-dideoxygalactose transaminase
MRKKPALPCTGRTAIEGFDVFLKTELNDSRGNIKKLASELSIITGDAQVTLVNSGSSANLTAAILVKQRCGSRKRVLMAGFSFPTTISSFTLQGFEVELVDTEADGFNLDPAALAQAIGDDVAAVVVTHFLGFPARLAQTSDLCRKHGSLMVQDACETMNLQADGRTIYEYGDVITHSFYHPHHLSAFGGGVVATRSKELHDQFQSIMHWGRECRCHYDPAACTAPHGLNHNFWYVREGVNLELSELNACFARWQLRTWQQQERLRWEHWRTWTNALSGISGVQTWPADQNISPFVFPIAVDASRFAELTDAIQTAGVEVRSLMGGAIHRHPAYHHLGHERLKQCERTGSRSFFVGIHQTLTRQQVAEASSIVHRILSQP